MILFRLAILLLITGTTFSLALAQDTPSDDLLADFAKMRASTKRVDAIFKEWDRHDSPGAAVGIVYNGEFIYKRGYGSANLDYEVPLDSSSVFYIASTSKQFAAASVALLHLEGDLNLDDDIRKYIPEIPDYGTPITIRHLVHHTSGLRDYLTLMSIAGLSFENYFNQDTALEFASRQKELNFTPGDEHLYSNTGYAMLAILVERVTGKTIREFGEERFFAPLGMTNTHWNDDRSAVVRNRVISYSTEGDTFKRLLKNFDAVGSGGLLTTVEDIAKWDQNFYDPKVGGQEFIDLMLTRGVLNDGEVLPYAFGLVHNNRRGLDNIQHGGGMLGFRTEFVRFPKQKFSVIVLCNLGSMSSSGLAMRVADVFLSSLQREVATSAGGLRLRETDPIKLDKDELRAKRGDYYDAESRQLWCLSMWRGSLQITRNGVASPLFSTSPTHFTVRDTNQKIVFDTAGDAKPGSFELRPKSGTIQTFNSVERPRLTESDTQAYVGRYYSEELDATYTISRDGRRLVVQRPGNEATNMRPVMPDGFRAGYGYHFERDASGNVTGFHLDAGRVRNLLFLRR